MLLDLLLTEPVAMILLAFVLAIVPLGVWTWVFLRVHAVDKGLAILTTLGGVLCVLPIWGYQWLFARYSHLDVFDMINDLDMHKSLIYLLTFVAVGVIEEQCKHWVVSIVDKRKKQWRGIADGIQFSVLAALGFAFIENIVYFVSIIKFEGMAFLLMPFVFRSVFSTFAHIFFSGIYGYHFAISKHAREWMIENMGPKHHHKFVVTRWIYKLFQIHAFNILARVAAIAAFAWLIWVAIFSLYMPILQNPVELMAIKVSLALGLLAFFYWGAHVLWRFWYHARRIHMDEIVAEEEVFEGLFLAMFFHAIFNFILWLEYTWLVPLYLFGGFAYLMYELKKQQNLLDLQAVEDEIENAKKLAKQK